MFAIFYFFKNESTLKVMEYIFVFTSKDFLVPQIFEILYF